MPDRRPDAQSDVDVQTMRKTLAEAAVAAAEREPSEIAVRARVRAEAEGAESARQLAALLEDPDWIVPPSALRRIAGALTYFGDPDCVPEATRAVPGQALVDWVAGELGAELAAWESFRSYRERLDRRRPGGEARTRKLYARRHRLRAALQSHHPD